MDKRLAKVEARTSTKHSLVARPFRRGHRDDGDDGFTLIELLVTLVITPLVMGGLAVALLSVFKNQSSLSNRITGSINSQLASAHMVKDVQDANYITTQSTPSCGSTGSQILGIRSQGNQVYVAYVTVANGSSYSLFRKLCTGGVTTTPVRSDLLSDNVPSNQSTLISCASTISCTVGTNWIPAAGVSKVDLAVTELQTGATYMLSAVPRAWNSASAGLAIDPFPIAPLTLLGKGTCPQMLLTLSGGAIVSIGGGAGPLVDNSTCAPSVSLSGSVSIEASGFATGDSTPSSTVTILKSGAVYPAPVYQTPTGDPLAGLLTPPPTPTTGLTGSCPASNISGTCTPGSFSAALTRNGASVTTFGSGTYVFNAPVTISNGALVTFGAGTYLFNQGLIISGSSPVTFNTGTYIFAGATSSSSALAVTNGAAIISGPGGVLFYVKSGVVSFTGNGQVALAGLSSYYGVSLWQDASDSNIITLQGSSAINAAYGGVYAPSGTISPSGSSVLSASFVICNAASLSGSAGLYVG